MNVINYQLPPHLHAIQRDTCAISFTMSSDLETGSLLRTLAASKPGGTFLEIGCGTGLSAAWILHGMSDEATLKTVDNDPKVIEIAKKHLGHDPRVQFYLMDGEKFIDRLKNETFDLVFADSWPGKYYHLEETLALVKMGGVYIIDDMLPQENWPAGHSKKVKTLIKYFDKNRKFVCTKLNWSTGIIIAVRISF